MRNSFSKATVSCTVAWLVFGAAISAQGGLIFDTPNPSASDWVLYTTGTAVNGAAQTDDGSTMTTNIGTDAAGGSGVGIGTYRNNFGSTALNVGATAVLMFDVTLTTGRTGGTGNARRFRFSLGDSNGSGTRYAGDGFGAGANDLFDRRHEFGVGAAGIGGSGGGGFFNKGPGAAGTWHSGLHGGDGGTGGNGPGINIPDGVAVTVVYELKRLTATTVDQTVTLSGGSTGNLNVTGSQQALDAIDTVAFGFNTPDNVQGASFVLDNVKLEIIPEPATLALLGLSGLAMLTRRRQ